MAEMEAKYPHLGFREWPFQVVPDENFVKIWADRKEILDDIQIILNTLERREQSTINLLWAWYGEGKSHTLKHICYLCHTTFCDLLPVYIEFPRTIRSFLDLYVYFITGLGEKVIKELAAEGGADESFVTIYPEFSKALKLMRSKSLPQQRMGAKWIMGNTMLSPSARKLGLNRPIENSDDAVRAMTCIMKMVKLSTKYHRILWMIDEFQRIRTEKPDIYEDINTGLHSVYNACPNNLSLFLSFSVRQQQNIFSLLSKEIIDRIGIQKIIAIHPLSAKESLTFVSDLMHEFRIDPGAVDSPFFPFEEDAVKFIVSLIEKNSELKPRAIMQYFNAVMEQADFRIARGEMQVIDLEFAKGILLDYDLFLSFQKESLLR
ncbi:hypothetical protein ACFLZ2_05045 [Candidatus Margulisiibacteriota bacterium]